LENVALFVEGAGLKGRLVQLFVQATEELLMNAFYNAPVDKNGSPRFAHFSKTRVASLNAGEQVEVVLAAGQDRVGVAVRDPFGSLGPSRVTRTLARCLTQRGSTGGQSGAGIGLYQVFQSVSSLIFNIAPNQRTEVIALTDLVSHRDFAVMGKSLSLFERASRN
jgi:hypothetical protein